MKKIFLTSLALLAMLFSLPLLPADAGDIRVGVYQNEPKVFVDENGKAEGFYIDLLEFIASKEGWRIQYVPGTWSQCIERLENGEIDLLPDIAYSEERAGRFDFNEKTVVSNWAVVYTASGLEIESFADLKGKKIAFMRGDITIEQLSSEIRPYGIDFSMIEADDYKGVFELLAQKKVDAGLVNHLFGLRHEKQYDLVRSPVICCPRELHFAVPKNKNTHLIQAIDRYLTIFKKDRESIYYRALTRWIEGKSPWKFPKWISSVLVIAGGLMVLFLVITVVSRFQVKSKTAELSDINRKLEAEIAERKRTEAVLKSERALLSALLDNIEEAVVACDKQGKLIHFNEAARRLHGLPEQPILPEQWSEYYHLFETDGNTPLKKEKIPLFRALQGESVRGMEMVVAPKNRNPRTLIASGQAFRDETERIVGAVIAMHDITERKQAEEALRQESAFSEAVLESLPGVFYLYDENRRFLRWNKNFTRVTGYTDAEMAHSHPLDFFTGPDQELLAERIQEVFTKGVSDVEADFVAKDGTRTPFYFTGLKTLIHGKVCLLGIGIDITERKRAEDELKKHQERLEELVRERTAELEEKIAEIEQMNRIFVGRELRMAELKEKIKDLEARIGD